MNQTIDYFLGVKEDKMKSRFVCDISNARLARNRIDRSEGFVAKYVVERVVYLAKYFFIYFREHLLEDNPNIVAHKHEMYIDNKGCFHVVMFCCLQGDIMLLVYSDGKDYAKYVSIISNGGEKVEPRFATSKRYSRKLKTQCRRTTATN